METEKHIKMFDRQVGIYEKMRQKDRFYKYRKALFEDAQGDVLEVAVGTGLNFPHYRNIDHVTAVDFSEKMLESAEKEAGKYPFPVTAINGDVENLKFQENSFDTIVSSLSFCSYVNPVDILNDFNRWCRPEGEILLLEHGLSRYKALQVIQRLADPISMRTIGCHQKRDITGFVTDSDLEIQKIERHVGGAVYMVRAMPQK